MNNKVILRNEKKEEVGNDKMKVKEYIKIVGIAQILIKEYIELIRKVLSSTTTIQENMKENEYSSEYRVLFSFNKRYGNIINRLAEDVNIRFYIIKSIIHFTSLDGLLKLFLKPIDLICPWLPVNKNQLAGFTFTLAHPYDIIYDKVRYEKYSQLLCKIPLVYDDFKSRISLNHVLQTPNDFFYVILALFNSIYANSSAYSIETIEKKIIPSILHYESTITDKYENAYDASLRRRSIKLLMDTATHPVFYKATLFSKEGEDLYKLQVLNHIVALNQQFPKTWVNQLLTTIEKDYLHDVYIPTMPGDLLSIIQEELKGLRWYNCPKGHPYSVGECGRPMQKSKCNHPGCGATIGGENHISAWGNTPINNNTNKIQKGYIIAGLNEPCRRLADSHTLLLRIFIHMIIFLSTLNSYSTSTILKTLKPIITVAIPVDQNNVNVKASLPEQNISTIEQLQWKLKEMIDYDWNKLLAYFKVIDVDLSLLYHIFIRKMENNEVIKSASIEKAESLLWAEQEMNNILNPFTANLRSQINIFKESVCSTSTKTTIKRLLEFDMWELVEIKDNAQILSKILDVPRQGNAQPVLQQHLLPGNNNNRRGRNNYYLQIQQEMIAYRQQRQQQRQMYQRQGKGRVLIANKASNDAGSTPVAGITTLEVKEYYCMDDDLMELNKLFTIRERTNYTEFEEKFRKLKAVQAKFYPLLGKLFKNEKQLRIVKYIQYILAWHKVLFKIYSDNTISREDALQITNRQAIENLPEESREEALRTFELFAVAFNESLPFIELIFECQPNPFLASDGSVDLSGGKLTNHRGVQMSLDVSIMFSIPSFTENRDDTMGLCTIKLLELMQQTQARLLEDFNNTDTPNHPLEPEEEVPRAPAPLVDHNIQPGLPGEAPQVLQVQVPANTTVTVAVTAPEQAVAEPAAAAEEVVAPPEEAPKDDSDYVILNYLTNEDVIKHTIIDYDKDKHLIPLLHIYNDQNLKELSKEIKYNYHDIEQSLLNTVFASKKPFKLQIRHFQYAGDLKIAGHLSGLNLRIPQVNMPDSVLENILLELDTHDRLRKILSHLEICISFIISIGVGELNGNISLTEFSQKTLLILPSVWQEITTTTITQQVYLKNLQSLFMFVEEQMKGNPLDLVAPQYRTKLDAEHKELLLSKSKIFDLTILLPMLRDLMTQQLCESKWAPTESLKDYLTFLSSSIDIEEAEWFREHFPETLTLANTFETHQLLSKVI